ncbi:UDP-glucose--hexose-1-phosphate uridylyltransferase [Vagococcus elongatus]|uniref:Galactose-1-phosphate uridylyltransferase n=1 Tax=Vagococcus elongatus TaxID=180344 RepID=A0A430B4L0_9ENTE|nr:UDP-glucose--hexose-1-phosphate uridylyltransferase [Vagococcus elongatus]RSU15191.1 UDP-glucose--hexose-1-phosphate uridylyltransferase [Vagococcus elongatus]
MTISNLIKQFVTFAIEDGGWMTMDRIYLENRILALIGEEVLEDEKITSSPSLSPLELVDQLVDQGIKNNPATIREILEGQLMDLMTPPPSVINALFAQHYDKNPKKATDYFYSLSKKNDYIKTRAIAKNIVFHSETDYGNLEITINLSKPEKDPKQIAAELTAKKVDYPKCMLCMENEGYLGRVNYPARSNHRIIRLNLDGESWGFQYSPYAYYNEHAIFLAEEHRPMKITKNSFEKLLRIIEVFPHYFVGSNADLPIVGGSILSHDHYQGGRHEFPMAKAPVEYPFDILGFPDVKAGIVKWPMSVIRLQGKEISSLVNSAAFISEAWKQYSDESLSIKAYSADGTPHHTVTPIARKNGEFFELDIVLRDNNVSEEFPDGIFHPHQDVHHIKKENIGLIEVMGLAVLPPRLKEELTEVEKFLLDKPNTIKDYHHKWAVNIKETETFNEETVSNVVQKAVGKVFLRVLEDAGVFKRNQTGQEGFKKFIKTLA